MPEFCPVVKSIFGDLPGVGFVGFDFSERIAAVLLDEQRIDCADKASGFMKRIGDGFIIAASVLHDDSCFSLQ